MLYVSYFSYKNKYSDINYIKYPLNNKYTQGIHKVDYYHCHKKNCLDKDTKMSYNYNPHTRGFTLDLFHRNERYC